MKLKLANTNARPIGVDIGTSTLKMAQLRFSQDTYELVGVGQAKIPESFVEQNSGYYKKLSEIISQLHRSQGFRGKDCVLAIPARDTFLRHLKMANTPDGDINAALMAEFAGKLPYPVEDAIIQHVVAGDIYDDGEAKQEIIAVAAHRKTVETYLKAINKAGLEVVGVNIEACAIVECFSRLFQRTADNGRTTLFIDIGASSTQVVLSHGPGLAFAHNLKRGAMQLDQALVKALDISKEEARQVRLDMVEKHSESSEFDPEQLYRFLDEPLALLSEELTQCLRYYESAFPNRSIERAIFVGGQACDKRLCQIIAQRLNLPAQIGDPLLRFNCADGVGVDMDLGDDKPHPALAVAVGLSLGATAA